MERVKSLESKLGTISSPLDVSNGGRAWNVVPQNLVQQRNSQDNNTLFIEFGAGVSTINSGTRNIEFYGKLLDPQLFSFVQGPHQVTHLQLLELYFITLILLQKSALFPLPKTLLPRQRHPQIKALQSLCPSKTLGWRSF